MNNRLHRATLILFIAIGVSIVCSRQALARGQSSEHKIKQILTNSIVDEKLKIQSFSDGAVIPRNYYFPYITWEDAQSTVDYYVVQFKSGDTEKIIKVGAKEWKPRNDFFKKLLENREIEISIFAVHKDQVRKSLQVKIIVSQAELNDAIIYRLVEPLFNPLQTSTVEILYLEQPSPQRLFAIPQTCIGCHSYSSEYNLFNVRRGKDRRLIVVDRAETPARTSQKLIGEFSSITISPDNRFAAIVLNTKSRIDIKKEYIEPFDMTYQAGDIFIYDFTKDQLSPLQGASELSFVEDMPFFSPDGTTVIFARYQSGDRGLGHIDLYEVPFNNGRGGVPTPVKNASRNGYDHYFPRYSPDGKWISFCRGDAQKGYFARRSSDIFLLPRNGGQPIRLNLNRDATMDSWHWWSSDSQWLLFASNRDSGQLTGLYLTRIESNGYDHPPCKLVSYNNQKINVPVFQKPFPLPSGRGIESFINKVYSQ